MDTAFSTHTVLWRNTQTLGTDFCTLRTHPSGCDLKGAVITVFESLPYLIYYEVRCDEAGKTRHLSVRLHSGEHVERLNLEVDAEQRWWRAGQELDDFRGFVDVDFGITPATNTLPVRRLQLAIGERQKIKAAWVRFPDLEVKPLHQHYTRLGERRYHYETTSGFEIDLEVNSVGLVTNYPDGWIAEAQRSNIDG